MVSKGSGPLWNVPWGKKLGRGEVPRGGKFLRPPANFWVKNQEKLEKIRKIKKKSRKISKLIPGASIPAIKY